MAGLALGFDLGGTQIRAALVRDGQILARASTLTDVAGGPEAVLAQFVALAAEVSQGQDPGIPAGVASPGPLDTVAGVVDAIPTLPGWQGFPLRQRLSQVLGRPAVVENDAISAAYGEWTHGAGQGLAHLVYVTISTGIGGGVILDGRLLHGRRGMAAHIGHMQLTPDGPACFCGRPGCFEAMASGSALGQRARVRAAANPDSWLGRLAAGKQLASHHVVQGARAGDAECLTLLADEANWLGAGFTNLAHLFSPEKIIMGGGVAQAFDLLAPGIHAVIARDALPAFKALQVVPAALGDNAGLLGAAQLALDSRA